MSSSMSASASMPATEAEARQAVAHLAKWWWAWLVTGLLWILASIVILQFRHASVTLAGVVIGIMFLAAGAQEFVLASLTEGWKWLWIALGAILVIAGIYALVNPVKTFIAVADIVGFAFALIGIFWIIEAFATSAANPLWWLSLVAGIIMVALGFWAAGQFLTTQAYTLLIFMGIWGLLHGISDIVKAFAIKQVGAMVTSQPSMAQPAMA